MVPNWCEKRSSRRENIVNNMWPAHVVPLYIFFAGILLVFPGFLWPVVSEILEDILTVVYISLKFQSK